MCEEKSFFILGLEKEKLICKKCIINLINALEVKHFEI